MINTANDRFPTIAGKRPGELTVSRASIMIAASLAAVETIVTAFAILLGLSRGGVMAAGPDLLLALGLAGLFVLLLQQMHGYRFAWLRQPERSLPRVLALGSLAVLAGLAVSAPLAGHEPTSLSALASTLVTFGLAVAAGRFGLAFGLQRAEAKGRLQWRLAVIDLQQQQSTAQRRQLIQQLHEYRHWQCRVDFVDREVAAEDDIDAILGRIRWADEIVVLSEPTTTPPPLLRCWLEALEVVPVEVSAAVPCGPALSGFALKTVHEAPLGPAAQAAKRLSDIVIAALALLFLAPLMILVAIAVKLDSPGPVFFRQIRCGYNNRTFGALKFRSLRHEMADPLANKLVTENDPRVTRVGGFLRRSSIDELPQLFNVLIGDMSLVGPRPHPLNAKAGGRLYEQVVERFQRRYRVRPGITGWAQVNGLRGNTETEDDLLRRVDFDLDYIRRWSLWLDLLILLRTPLATLKGENAR